MVAVVRVCLRLCWHLLALIGLTAVGLLVLRATLPHWHALMLMRSDWVLRDGAVLLFAGTPEAAGTGSSWWGVDVAGFARVPESLYGRAVTVQDARSRRVLCSVPAPGDLPLTEPTLVRWLDWPRVSDPPGGPECAWELLVPHTATAAARWAGESHETRDGAPKPARVFLRNVGTERYLAPSTLKMEKSPFDSIHQAIGGLYHPDASNAARFYPATATKPSLEAHLLWDDAMLLAPETTAFFSQDTNAAGWAPAGTYPLSARQGQGVDIATVIVAAAPRSMDYLGGAGVTDAASERLDVAVVRNATVAPGSLVFVAAAAAADDDSGAARVVSVVPSSSSAELLSNVRQAFHTGARGGGDGRFCSRQEGLVEAVIEMPTRPDAQTPVISGLVVSCGAPDHIPELLTVSVSEDNRTWHLADIMRFRLQRPVTHPNPPMVFRMAASVAAGRYVRVGFYASGLRPFCVNEFALVQNPNSAEDPAVPAAASQRHAAVLGRVEAVLSDLPAVGSLSALSRVARAPYAAAPDADNADL